MNKANECTCPSGDGSLVHPCPAHPAVDQADVAAKLTFINGRPAMCGCQVEYSDGGGEYSDVIYVTLCAKHSGSAILDLVATNRIALTPEYEGQWHADLYLDREIPLAKVEGATPAEAVLALMSAERIDPEQESVEQAGGERRHALQSIMEWTAAENIPDDRKLCLIRNAARAALAQAEAERPELWAVHAQGPDELYAAFTREDAEKHAAELNALPMPEGIAVGAVVVPSPWPEAEHWKYLAEQEREHIDVARAALAHAPTSSASPSCKWTESSGIWETGCGQTWSFIEDGPAENGALFCHHCGGRLVLIKSDDQEDDGEPCPECMEHGCNGECAGHGAMGD
ncbi:hypothetical protein JTM35_07135 [Pseudomonas aeruginosa]|nr:hypothetical protein [Pseudomonas aeruginosa]